MKFVHIADMHFDSPFVNLSDKENLGDLRRLEQRKVFKKVIEYIKENVPKAEDMINNLISKIGDIKDNKDIQEDYDRHFASGCSKSLACMEVCPMKLPTLSSMAKLNRMGGR